MKPKEYLRVKVYYIVDNGKIVYDQESMKEEFNLKLRELLKSNGK